FDQQDRDAFIEAEDTLGDPSARICGGRARIEAARQPPSILPLRVQLEKVTHGGQGERRSKWQRRKRRHGSDRPVVWTIGHAAGGVFEEATFPTAAANRPPPR